jgi:hypothetical protein
MQALAITLILLLASAGASAEAEAFGATPPEFTVGKFGSNQLATSESVYPARDFLDVCEAEAAGTIAPRQPCSAYISGVFAAMAMATTSENDGESRTCLPAERVPGEQLLEIFIDYARRNPGALDKYRLDAIQDAFVEAFPCL